MRSGEIATDILMTDFVRLFSSVSADLDSQDRFSRTMQRGERRGKEGRRKERRQADLYARRNSGMMEHE